MQRNEARLDFLDGIRGVAILGVFIFHCHGEVYGWDLDPAHVSSLSRTLLYPLTLGGIGVSIFFVVSGFCIHLSHARSNRKDWPAFFVRRFFRIYPPYLVTLLIFSFVPPWRFVSSDPDFGWMQLITHLFLFHNFGQRTLYGINGSFWSIAVEVQLYALYPALLWLVRKLGWTGALCLTAGLEISFRTCLAVHAIISSAPPAGWIFGCPLGYWFSWAVGAAAAEAYLKGDTPPFARVPLWVFPVLMVTTGMYAPLQSFGFLLAALSTVCFINRLVAKTEHRPPDRPPWWQRHLGFAGLVSYSAYLIHQPFVVVIVGRLERTRLHPEPFLILLLTCASWIPVLALSWCLYRLLELPSIALGKWMVRMGLGPAPIERARESQIG